MPTPATDRNSVSGVTVEGAEAAAGAVGVDAAGAADRTVRSSAGIASSVAEAVAAGSAIPLPVPWTTAIAIRMAPRMPAIFPVPADSSVVAGAGDSGFVVAVVVDAFSRTSRSR